jgi:TolB-like protein
MIGDSARPPCWRFGNVVVDTALHRVLVGGVPQELEPKSFRLLQFLIAHRERVVTKQEIFAAVWAGTVVSDNALTRAIAQIRKCLADDPKQPRYIETIPTVGYRLIADVEAPSFFTFTGESHKPVAPVEDVPEGEGPSIAVLPFANLSADKENEYFADGLAEEILNALARIPDLKVIARTSSFAFRGKEQDVTAIAAALRVHHVLEGSVRRAGTRIRVTAQLIAAGDGSHVWSERYDRGITDVFAIQDEISEAIATALRVRLAPPVRTANLGAYQLHLKGRHHLLRLSREGLARARACFDQALAIDPGYAPAHSALAEHHHTVYILGLERRRRRP